MEAAGGHTSCASGYRVRTRVWSQTSQTHQHWIENFGYTGILGSTGYSYYPSNRLYADWQGGIYWAWQNYYTNGTTATAHGLCYAI